MFPTWQVRRAFSEIAEDGQTRCSQEERISDGWESPIWEEHPWRLKVLKLLRSIRKSSRSTEFQVLCRSQEMRGPTLPSSSHHTTATPGSRLLWGWALCSALWVDSKLRDALRRQPTWRTDAPVHGRKDPEFLARHADAGVCDWTELLCSLWPLNFRLRSLFSFNSFSLSLTNIRTRTVKFDL